MEGVGIIKTRQGKVYRLEYSSPQEFERAQAQYRDIRKREGVTSSYWGSGQALNVGKGQNVSIQRKLGTRTAGETQFGSAKAKEKYYGVYEKPPEPEPDPNRSAVVGSLISTKSGEEFVKKATQEERGELVKGTSIKKVTPIGSKGSILAVSEAKEEGKGVEVVGRTSKEEGLLFKNVRGREEFEKQERIKRNLEKPIFNKGRVEAEIAYRTERLKERAAPVIDKAKRTYSKRAAPIISKIGKRDKKEFNIFYRGAQKIRAKDWKGADFEWQKRGREKVASTLETIGYGYKKGNKYFDTKIGERVTEIKLRRKLKAGMGEGVRDKYTELKYGKVVSGFIKREKRKKKRWESYFPELPDYKDLPKLARTYFKSTAGATIALAAPVAIPYVLSSEKRKQQFKKASDIGGEFAYGTFKGEYETVKYEPEKVAIYAGVGYGFKLAGTGFRAARRTIKGTKYVAALREEPFFARNLQRGGRVGTAAETGLTYGVGAVYAGSVGYRFYTAPSYQEKGEVIGKAISSEVLPLAGGSYLADKTIKYGKAAYYTYSPKYKKVDILRITRKKVVTGKQSFPELPQSKQLKEFQLSERARDIARRAGLESKGNQYGIRAQRETKPKIDFERPSEYELPGGYYSTEGSIYFIMGKRYNIYGKGSAEGSSTIIIRRINEFRNIPKNLKSTMTSDEIGKAVFKKSGFKFKASKKGIWKKQSEFILKGKKEVGYIPGVKTETEAVLRFGTKDIRTKTPKKLYTVVPTEKSALSKEYMKRYGKEFAFKRVPKFNIKKPSSYFPSLYFGYKGYKAGQFKPRSFGFRMGDYIKLDFREPYGGVKKVKPFSSSDFTSSKKKSPKSSYEFRTARTTLITPKSLSSAMGYRTFRTSYSSKLSSSISKYSSGSSSSSSSRSSSSTRSSSSRLRSSFKSLSSSSRASSSSSRFMPRPSSSSSFSSFRRVSQAPIRIRFSERTKTFKIGKEIKTFAKRKYTPSLVGIDLPEIKGKKPSSLKKFSGLEIRRVFK